MAAKILVVDDSNTLKGSIRKILSASGYLVIEAADCQNALSLLASETFDLVLLDITLPDRSGFKVLEFLRENHVAAKVIVITGTAGLQNAIKSTNPGPQDYITKPYNPDYLLKSIAHILSGQLRENLKLQIIKAGDFIKSTPTGNLDMKASEDGLAEITAAGADLQDYTVLIDLRDITSRLTTADIYELASRLAKYGETFRRKTALLARADEDLNQATFFQAVARNRGFNVRAFTDFEDAVLWLSGITQLTENLT